MSKTIQYLEEATVASVLRLEDLIPAMEQALTDFSAGRVVQPVRQIVDVKASGGFMGLMPAIQGDIMGCKLVNFFPRNTDKWLPTHFAVIALFRADTGEPLAMMDGGLITELRTAAVSAAAVKLLATENPKKLAILGSGTQARAHWQALSLVRKFESVAVWSRNGEHAQQFAGKIGAEATAAEAAVRDADVVVCVTSTTEPVLRGAWLKPGALVCAVGAVGATRRELDDEAMRGAVIVDSRAAAMVESGDVLMAKATINAELGELLAGTKPIPTAKFTVFKSLGLAVEDLASAKLVMEKLKPAG